MLPIGDMFSRIFFEDAVAPPKLVLLYPYSEKFTNELPAFVYDDMNDGLGLKLTAIPFNLADPNTYQSQIENIIRMLT